MGIFYFDDKLQAYEGLYQWEQALNYLEDLYSERKDPRILCSLVGFSWFYLMEGSVVSKKYENGYNTMALETWKKYIDIGVLEANEDPFFNFIAGYTLSLHGYHIGEEYEKSGNKFIENCVNSSKDVLLQQLTENFILNEHSKRYIPVKNGEEICSQFFNGSSLLDEYFREIYASKRKLP